MTVDLYWIPLGARQHVVRISGWIYEALVALVQRRPRCRLYHSALVAHGPRGPVVIEMTLIRDDQGAERGVVGEVPVGMRWLGRFRLFLVFPARAAPTSPRSAERPQTSRLSGRRRARVQT